MNSNFVISQTDGRPMYLQIMEQVKQRVAVGHWKPGQEIPSIRRLAVDVRVSVITVRRAYLELEREGVIVTRQGKGSHVATGADLAANLSQQKLDEHLAEAAKLGSLLGLEPEELKSRLCEAMERMAKEQT